MSLAAWYADTEAGRRVAQAQLALWFAGAAPLVALAYLLAELTLGHPAESAGLVVPAYQSVAAVLWTACCVTSGVLLGRRRRSGLYMGLALFAGLAAWGAFQPGLRPVIIVIAGAGLTLLGRARRAMAPA